MDWKGRRKSSNVEDRRGQSAGRRRGGGLKLGGGAMLLIAIVAVLLGQNPLEILGLLDSSGVSVSTDSAPRGGGAPVQDEASEFMSVVLADTEETWNQLFAAEGQRYREPTLVLFSDAVNSACGYNSAAVGPFYCPADQKVYIDTTFFSELSRRFGAPGDFAQAYVLAHEVGHHVQNLLGISTQVHELRSRSSESQGNALSVRMELQADCLAGVWGHHAASQRQLLEQGDIEEGMRAAAAIGDDRMQRHAGRAISPESWTHGSSEQRARWFKQGLQSGDMATCDTFAANQL